MSATDRDLEMMAWLAERDMEAVAHAHAQFTAATDPDEVASLGRTYQRVSRCLRSTLALKMKAQQGQADEAARAKILGRRDAFAREQRIETRTRELQDAVERVAAAAVADPEAREERLTDFDMALDDWIEQPDFLTADLDEQVRRACHMLDLPEELGRVWRTLPRPVFEDDQAQADDPPSDEAAAAPPPHRDSG
ncbi:hypothetical protein [Phenylobacterium sp.]|uniref:hypothetical protein n=1 Tax=Phenylobacterium sp. TaxID=1871053 RepID=UPI0025F125AC|nr:hypothetical protein [Phenylobacterium sp.]